MRTPTPTYEELAARLEWIKSRKIYKIMTRQVTQLRDLNRRVKQLQAELQASQDGTVLCDVPIVRRRKYDGKRDVSGRTIFRCIRCGTLGPVHGRSMCSRCYMQWYRNQRRHTENLGSVQAWRLPGLRQHSVTEMGEAGEEDRNDIHQI